MENSKEFQSLQLKNAMGNVKEGTMQKGELPDDALDGVAGGAVLNSVFYIAKCTLCGWQSQPFDGQGDSDTGVVVFDHIRQHPECSGNFEVYQFDSRSVHLG